MKEIIIKKANAEKIMAVIKTAQGKATARTIDSFEEILRIIDGVERRIGTMPKTALEGTTVHYDFRQHFPSAYRYTPDSTHLDLRYHNGSWRLTAVTRMRCPNGSTYEYELCLSDSAKNAILARYK